MNMLSKYVGLLVTLGTVLFPRTLFCLADDESCMAAFSKMHKEKRYACNTEGLTSEQLRSDACPFECQALLNQVIENCRVGVDKYLPDYDDFQFIYKPATLYHEMFSDEIKSHWASCDYGYNPTPCDIALGNLDNTRMNLTDYVPDTSLPNTSSGPRVCTAYNNRESCTLECMMLLDGVVHHCDNVENAMFSPEHGYREAIGTVIPWERRAMVRYGMSPGRGAPFTTLSLPCWNLYKASTSISDSNNPLDSTYSGTESIAISWQKWIYVSFAFFYIFWY